MSAEVIGVLKERFASIIVIREQPQFYHVLCGIIAMTNAVVIGNSHGWDEIEICHG